MHLKNSFTKRSIQPFYRVLIPWVAAELQAFSADFGQERTYTPSWSPANVSASQSMPLKEIYYTFFFYNSKPLLGLLRTCPWRAFIKIQLACFGHVSWSEPAVILLQYCWANGKSWRRTTAGLEVFFGTADPYPPSLASRVDDGLCKQKPDHLNQVCWRRETHKTGLIGVPQDQTLAHVPKSKKLHTLLNLMKRLLRNVAAVKAEGGKMSNKHVIKTRMSPKFIHESRQASEYEYPTFFFQAWCVCKIGFHACFDHVNQHNISWQTAHCHGNDYKCF